MQVTPEQIEASRAVDAAVTAWLRRNGFRFSFLLPLFLVGCITTDGPASVSTGECKVFVAPRYAVKGARPYDQDWIDSTVEGGVGACHWQRPAVRPAALDAPAPRKAAPTAKPKPKKKPLWLRMLRAVKPKPAPATPEPTLTFLPAEPDAPAPRSAIDELLSPASGLAK